MLGEPLRTTHEGPIIPPRREPGCLPREMSLSSLEARPSASCPSSPTAAICCWRINRGAAPLTSKLLLIMPSDLPTERRTSYWQCRCQRTVLPRGKSNNNNKLLISPKVDPKAAAAPPFYKPGIGPPLCGSSSFPGLIKGGRAGRRLFLLMAFTVSVNIVIVGDKWARALGSPEQGGTVMPQSWPVSTAQGAA